MIKTMKMKKINSYILGIDTSNYTTSACLYNTESGCVVSERKLLPVKDGHLGLRQSDAVFHHTQQLPVIISSLFSKVDADVNVLAVGVSEKPRDEKGSYMPCFTVGKGVAEILGTTLNIPVYYFSHQSGHIAAAIYSSSSKHLFEREFIAFHVSGGTTEAVLVKPDKEKIFDTALAASSLDLHAGQAIDRIGVSLGLKFPCGAELEKLALNSVKNIKVKPCIKGKNCCLSGIENICSKMLSNGEKCEDIAYTCLMFIAMSLEGMCNGIISQYGHMPILFAGGVMSNSIIRQYLSERFDCIFAKPEFSTDNACGTSVLAYKKYIKELNI